MTTRIGPADTRERLVTAAMELFWEKGYGSTSIADILRKAQANSGSLYHYFPAKQDLLNAVLDTYLNGIRPMLLEPAWQGVDDPLERIFVLLDRYRQLLVETDCFYGCPIGNLALELLEPDPAVRERLAANFSAWTGAIEECLAAAAERLPGDIDRQSLAQFVLTTMEGGVMQARTHRSLQPFDASVGQLRNYFVCLAALAHDGEGEGYAELLEFFRAGNAWTFERLKRRFDEGPLEWKTEPATTPDAATTSNNKREK